MATIIDGAKAASDFCDSIAGRVKELKTKGIFPKLALINASDDPASGIYVSNKQKLAQKVGIESVVKKFSASSVSASELVDTIEAFNTDPMCHGILLQAPLAKHLSFRDLVNKINPNKDVDGLTTINQGRLFAGEAGVLPCTPLGVLHLLHMVHPKLAGLHAVVLGRSSIVGRPLSQLLLNANCTVTLLHSYSKNLSEICRTADILVSAIGKPLFVGANFVKPGATVIDVGINRIFEKDKQRIVGDVDFSNVKEISGAISPVPKGVGPMTVAYLMHNAVSLACCC